MCSPKIQSFIKEGRKKGALEKASSVLCHCQQEQNQLHQTIFCELLPQFWPLLS